MSATYTKEQLIAYMEHALTAYVNCCLGEPIEVNARDVCRTVAAHPDSHHYKVNIQDEGDGFLLFIESTTTNQPQP